MFAEEPGGLGTRPGAGRGSGDGALVFGEANPTARSLAELNLGGFGIWLRRPDLASVGRFGGVLSTADDVQFYFKLAGEPSPFEGLLSFRAAFGTIAAVGRLGRLDLVVERQRRAAFLRRLPNRLGIREALGPYRLEEHR